MLSNGIRFSKVEVWLREKFLQLITENDYNQSSKRILNIVQEWVSAGGDGCVRWASNDELLLNIHTSFYGQLYRRHSCNV